MVHILKFGRIAVLCAAIAALFALVGCESASLTPEQQAQQANRAYMSQVNQIMEELDADLDGFVAAVSGDDLVGMGIQSGNAKRTIEKLASLEAPEVFADVQESYVKGARDLEAALDAYVALYSDAKRAMEAGTFDAAEFDERLAEVQAAYDEGIAALQAADDAVAAK